MYMCMYCMYTMHTLYLSNRFLQFLFKDDKRESKQSHDETMTSITKHDSKEKRERNDSIQSYRKRDKITRNVQCTSVFIIIFSIHSNSFHSSIQSPLPFHYSHASLPLSPFPSLIHIPPLTWIDLLIGSNAISINDILKPSSKLVSLEVSGRRVSGVHPVQDRGDSRATSLL